MHRYVLVNDMHMDAMATSKAELQATNRSECNSTLRNLVTKRHVLQDCALTSAKDWLPSTAVLCEKLVHLDS